MSRIPPSTLRYARSGCLIASKNAKRFCRSEDLQAGLQIAKILSDKDRLLSGRSGPTGIGFSKSCRFASSSLDIYLRSSALSQLSRCSSSGCPIYCRKKPRSLEKSREEKGCTQCAGKHPNLADCECTLRSLKRRNRLARVLLYQN